MNGLTLKLVDKFTYLGSTLSRAVHIDDEVDWLQSLKHFFFHKVFSASLFQVFVANLLLMAQFI